MARRIVLRCQYGAGERCTLNELSANSSFQQLQDAIMNLTNISPQQQKIMFGFPPKPLDFPPASTKLGETNIKSGETLIVSEDKEVTQAYSSQSNAVSQKKIVREVVPANNSCLFASISFVLFSSENFADDMRQIAASCIAADPTTYSEVFLAKPNEEYCEWLTNKQHWGGAIELDVLSQYNQIEINVADIQSGRMDRYGEEKSYERRVFLLYDGIHYDPLALEEGGVITQTIFQTTDVEWQEQALALAEECKKRREFTDLAGFSLRCLVCNTPLKGQTQAQQHAKSTGHMNFGEV